MGWCDECELRHDIFELRLLLRLPVHISIEASISTDKLRFCTQTFLVSFPTIPFSQKTAIDPGSAWGNDESLCSVPGLRYRPAHRQATRLPLLRGAALTRGIRGHVIFQVDTNQHDLKQTFNLLVLFSQSTYLYSYLKFIEIRYYSIKRVRRCRAPSNVLGSNWEKTTAMFA